MNIFIHRRDLRYEDNTSLLNLYSKFKDFIPIFIFDPIQIEKNKNKYYSNNLVQFLCSSLLDLKTRYKKLNINFNIFYGDTIKVLDDLNKNNKINSISFNIDYSPFSKNRDTNIIGWCNKNSINCFNYEDMLLIDINSGRGLKPNNKEPYLVFTPFMRNLKKYEVNIPNNTKIKKRKINQEIVSNFLINNDSELDNFYDENNNIHVIGNRKKAIDILKNMKNFNNYDKCRNYLSYSTTSLSAYINLGLLSIREIYHTIQKELGQNSGLITELYWRDFYYNILHYYPDNIGNAHQIKYNQINWENNSEYIDKWKNGLTGFPIVDACMRQLNETGYMHNRGRMIVASFLTKDLLCDWQIGEQYFATKLVDYNMSANNGGWQWAAGTGTDSQPYYRIFNPWKQSKDYDSDCIYIKKWVPELKNVENKDIHNWNEKYLNYNIDYPKPIVDHSTQRILALNIYKSIK